jgi:hypothetical protein
MVLCAAQASKQTSELEIWMAEPHVTIPTGVEHLALIRTLTQIAIRQSDKELPKHIDKLKFFGTALAALYEASTCHRKCFGGGHVLERLCGRAYNLGVSASCYRIPW